MSYDLLVFDPASAPRERVAFKDWFARESRWNPEESYDDPSITTEGLRGWYNEICETFPDFNSPEGFPDDREDVGSDYTIAANLIYVAFPWAVAEEAYPLVRNLAVRHGVGFYDVSGDEGDGEIYFPGDALRPESQGSWREIASVVGSLPKGPHPTGAKRSWRDLFRRK